MFPAQRALTLAATVAITLSTIVVAHHKELSPVATDALEGKHRAKAEKMDAEWAKLAHVRHEKAQIADRLIAGDMTLDEAIGVFHRVHAADPTYLIRLQYVYPDAFGAQLVALDVLAEVRLRLGDENASAGAVLERLECEYEAHKAQVEHVRGPRG